MNGSNTFLLTPLGRFLFVPAWLVFFLAFSGSVSAQKSRTQLEKEKRQNQRKIAATERILKETAQEREASLGQLSALNQQILSRSEQINVINREIQLLDREMRELAQIVYAMENDVIKLQQEYSSMIYAASKANSNYNRLVFLFSSDTFYQFVMRLKYLQQYAEIRKLQVQQIQRMKTVLGDQRVRMEFKKQEKNLLLQSQMTENSNLLALKSQKSEVVEKLTSRERELTQELQDSREAVARVDKLITDLVEAERRAEAEAGTSRSSAGANASFSGSKSKLHWPVKSGFISGKFGEQPHPVLKGIKVDNPGINIQTNKGEEVRAVYDGEIWTVAVIPGFQKLVAVRHGDYTTVYVKLGKVYVKEGDKVKANQAIGEVFTEKDGTTEIQFQIWRNSEKLNPESWLLDK